MERYTENSLSRIARIQLTSYNHTLCARVLEIFIEQNPEIRKAGQCTENTSCRIIGNTRKYVFPSEDLFSSQKHTRSCWVIESPQFVHRNRSFFSRMFQEYVWENICDVREDCDLLSLNFAFSDGKTHEARSGSRFWFRLVPTLQAELFSTARVYKSKGIESERGRARFLK